MLSLLIAGWKTQKPWRAVVFLLLFLTGQNCPAAAPGRQTLAGYVSPVADASASPLANTNEIYLAIGLPLHHEDVLDGLLRQLYDPQSTNYHRYLSPAEFAARFGPTEQDYAAVVRFAETNGLRVAGRHANRLVLDVAGSAGNVGQAFQVTLRTYQHPRERRRFYAPDVEPSVPANVPVADVWGLTDFGRPQPQVIPEGLGSPLNYNGSGPGGSYRGGDFRHAYVPGTALAGSGQTAAVVEFDGYYLTDITNYEAQIGYTNVPVNNVYVDGVSGTPGFSGDTNAVIEVSLDIEMIVSMAPALADVIVYEGNSAYDVFNRIVTDDTAKQISCSWTFPYGPTVNWKGGRHGTSTLDSQLKEMDAQGQSFFQASGDADAYTGSEAVNSSTGPIPVDSIYLTSVGGTSLTMNGAGAGWSGETVWNWGNNEGSSGGVSPNYAIPAWQTNANAAAAGGSKVYRNLPDVAMTADAVTVDYGNGGTITVGGTSCAAPLWAGFCALVNQQAAAFGNVTNTVGFLNPALYSLAAGAGYANCFHDITTGNNIGTNTAGLYYATNGYDLCTGLGTPNGTNLINALAPPAMPYFIAQPPSLTVTNGGSVMLSALAIGQAPLTYHWLFNGAALTAGNVAGTPGVALVLTNVTAANAGSYSVMAANGTGSATSLAAAVTVLLPPVITVPPASQIVWAGSNAVFGVTATSTVAMAYQWLKGGSNLVDNAGFSGVNTAQLTVLAPATNGGGNFSVLVTNVYGAATSAVASLVVVQSALISTTLTPQTVECGGSALFAVTALANPPAAYQWSEDGAAIGGATNAALVLTNVHLPSHVISVAVTNLYGGAMTSATLTVQDTQPPVIILDGANPFYVELGTTFVDPGATAVDVCAGVVAVSVTGTVNTNAVGTNQLIYQATDGNGNGAGAARVVIVRDTTAPTIEWSFTNLVLAAGAGCSAAMPDVTGTNFIVAADLSGPPVVTQNPATNAVLGLGSTTVILAATDAWGNVAYSTNTIVVRDETAPVMGEEPQSETNDAGAAASFTVSATACTPLEYQWFFNGAILPSQTNTTLTLASAGLTNAGNYFAVATAGGGSSTSSVAVLTIVSPPMIVASFTNLTLAAGSNCEATLPDLTGTNFLQATVGSGTPVITQSPAPNSRLPLGTNFVVLALSDAWDNVAYATDVVVVADETPPMIVEEPQSETNGVGTSASFSVSATACTPLAYQWFFNGGVLSSQTNATLALADVALTNAGGYFAVATAAGGASTSCVVALTVEVAPAPIWLTVTSAGAGGVALAATGPPGAACIVETSTNLPGREGWQELLTNDFDAGGAAEFLDPSATNDTQRFYRARLGP